MAFSVNDKVKKLVSDPRAAFPQVGMGQEMLDAIEADLQAIGD